MPDRYRAHEHAPDQPAEGKLQGGDETPGCQGADQGPSAKKSRPLDPMQHSPDARPLEPLVEAILEQVARITIVGAEVVDCGVVNE